jgi:hypothetical protein
MGSSNATGGGSPGFDDVLAARLARLQEATAYAHKRWPDTKPEPKHPAVKALIDWIADGGPRPWKDDDPWATQT